MTLLPVVQRELRVAARRRRTYWVRIGAAASVLTLAGWVFLMMRHESPRQLSSILFVLVTATAGLYALLGGVGATSDTLSQEKREGTLGLLFLTDLKGYDIVLGKLVASSVSAFYGVLAVLPILAVPLLLGGITPEEVGRMSLVVVNALFLSLSAGMFASSFNRDSRRSASLTFLLLGTLTAVLPGIAAWLASQGKFPRLQEVLYWPSVGYAYVMAFDRFAAAPSSRFWQSMGVIHAFGWGFLLFASLIAPHSWQDRPAGRSRFPLREAWRMLSYGGAPARAVFRRRLLDVNPFYWLTARIRLRPAMVWIALAALAGLWIWGLIELKHDWFNEGIYVTTALVLNVLLKVWLGSEACRQLAEERQQGTLELLLSTPLSVREILE
ncbi:MAG TPA: ABC transporter permease, partial [Clostridia bacterium]|nr:ABC transporter permease [Clostridia bacterium]